MVFIVLPCFTHIIYYTCHGFKGFTLGLNYHVSAGSSVGPAEGQSTAHSLRLTKYRTCRCLVKLCALVTVTVGCYDYHHHFRWCFMVLPAVPSWKYWSKNHLKSFWIHRKLLLPSPKNNTTIPSADRGVGGFLLFLVPHPDAAGWSFRGAKSNGFQPFLGVGRFVLDRWKMSGCGFELQIIGICWNLRILGDHVFKLEFHVTSFLGRCNCCGSNVDATWYSTCCDARANRT